MNINKIKQLTKQLFPTGRAWRIWSGSVFEKLVEGLNLSEWKALEFCQNILNTILPDNDKFTASDAAQWERRLGLPVLPEFTNLEQRKEIILRKYNFPGTFLYRQNWRYLEFQLRLAGYDVYVYENLGGVTDLLDTFVLQHSEDLEHSDTTEMGGSTIDLIANSHKRGEAFDLPNAKGVFYIAGADINTPALINVNLIEPFRKLVLSLKPVNSIAVLNVIYGLGANFVFMDGNNFVFEDDDNFIFND